MRLDAALARALRDHGVDTIFGLLADPTMMLAYSFVHDENGTYLSAAHEVGATHMAYGYGTVSGKLGVALIDHGPGLTNSLTAVIDAVKARQPMLVIYPDTNVEEKHYRQDIPHREFIVPTGAGFEQVRSPATALMDMAVAIRRAQYESRPVALNVPRVFMPAETEYVRTVLPPMPIPNIGIDEASLDTAVGIIASARRPVVLGGRGAVDARAELIRLADRIGAPLATTLGGKDLFRGEPFDLEIMGSLSNGTTLEIVAEADCIVAFGAGLNDDTTMKGSILAGKRVVHCDIDPERLGRVSLVDCMVLGDAADAADTFVEWLDQGEIPSSSFRTPAMAERLEAERRRVDRAVPSRPGTVDLTRAVAAIDQAVPAERIYVNDPGRHCAVTWPGVHVKGPRDFVLTANFGAIGTGMPIAVGAGCVGRDRPVLLFIGDGALMLGGLSEFNSAVRHGVDLVVVVCNDGAYGPEHERLDNRGLEPGIVEFQWPDFGPVAEALGGQGITVRDEDDLRSACKAIGDRSKPLLIDLKLDPYGLPETPDNPHH